MSVFYVYNEVFLYGFHDFEIIFERDQLGMTWDAIRKKRNISLSRVKKEYDEAMFVYETAKRFAAVRARVEWFNGYFDKIDWREYKDIEAEVLSACGLYRVNRLLGDKVTLNVRAYDEEHKNDSFKSFTYDQRLLNDLIIERMKQLVKMKKKAAKVLKDIGWAKGE